MLSHTSTRRSTLKELRESIPLTQAELAIQAAVSRHSVMRQEQLCYPTPLPNIVDTIGDIVGTDSKVLNRLYLADVQLNRELSGQEFFSNHDYMAAVAEHLIKHWSPAAYHGQHPFEAWRIILTDYIGLPSSRIHFSQITSIHPATLSRYESFNTGFPPPAEVAFRAMGFPESLLDLFKHRVFNLSEGETVGANEFAARTG